MTDDFLGRFPDLPLLAHSDNDVYRCPGESASISRPVHLARLASGWSGCTTCSHNDDVAINGVAENLKSTHVSHRSSIRRTSFGVRGAYLNAIGRAEGAVLGAIFSRCLTQLNDQQELDSSKTIAIGYDNRPGSPDVFAGVVSAVLQNGNDVVDAGLCTAASLLTVSRTNTGISGILMVTGANGSSGDVGIDVLSSDGRSVSIPWHEFGVGVRLSETSGKLNNESNDSGNRFTLLRDSSGLEPVNQGELLDVNERGATIQLPELKNSGLLFRSGRRSGQLNSIRSEAIYMDWLKHWWPARLVEPMRFRVCDDLAKQRLQRLMVQFGLSLQIEVTASKNSSTGGEHVPTFVIDEDDRFVTILGRNGRALSSEAVATWMNQATRDTSLHVTAHASPDTSGLLLVDVASPDSGNSHVVIRDALAAAGFALTLLDNDRNQLPS